MAAVTCFEDLLAWQRARELTSLVYRLSRDKPFASDFDMKDQIRSAARSVMDNIAEGFDRQRDREFLYFLRVAKASCGEVRSQSYVAFDQAYINEESLKALLHKTSQASGAIRRLQQSIAQNPSGTRDPGPGTKECS